LTPALELAGLTKWYGRHRGVLDVDLTVGEGEIFGFIGPNGAGKSTTIRLLLGLIRPTRGSARIRGEVVTPGAGALKREVGYLPAEARYYGDLTVRELLRYSAAFYPDRRLADLPALAERLDLDLSARIERLSFGNRKKVGIAQALLHKPRILILDEPTSGLDPLIQNRFFEILEECSADGVTVFFSSHVLSEVQRLCHRVGILREGRLVAVEQVEALRARAVKRVRVEWRGDRAWLPPGAKNVERTGPAVSFLYQGQAPDLLGQLAEHAEDAVDVSIEQPSLEEVFLHYYGQTDSGQGDLGVASPAAAQLPLLEAPAQRDRP